MNAELDLTGLRRIDRRGRARPGRRRIRLRRAAAYNALIDRRPAVIARCLAPAMLRPLRFRARPRARGRRARRRAQPAGHCVCDGGLVIDLSLMREVDVDAEARIARAEGGATGSTSTPPRRRSGSSRRVASSAPPVSPA